MIRMSASISSSPPSRQKRLSCRTRNSLTCTIGVISAISSRNSVPRSATSISPFLLTAAPVKAPRTWPNSSDSSSVSGSAPQLSATNGRSRRGELKWMARATSSLPVPESPVTRIVLVVEATVSIRRNTATIASLRPMMLQNWCEVPSVRLRSRFSCWSWRRSRRRELGAAFFNVVRRPEPQRLHRRFLGGIGRDHDAEDIGVEPLGRAQHLYAVHVRHPDIGHEQVHATGLEQGNRLAPVLGQQHLEPLALQPIRQQLADRGFVVHEEDLGRGRR